MSRLNWSLTEPLGDELAVRFLDQMLSNYRTTPDNERGRIVRLVVEGVDMAVQKLAHIRHWAGGMPGVKQSVDQVEVRHSPVGCGEGQQKVHSRGMAHFGECEDS